MRTSVYVLAALAAAGLTTASAQNTGNPATTPGTQTPVHQPRTSSPPSTPTPSTRTSPTPSQPTQPSSQVTMPSQSSQPSSQVTTPSQPTQPSAATPSQPSQTTQQTQPNATTQQTQPNANTQQTVRPPDSARNNANTRTNDAANNANNATQQNQSRVPPAMRGVGTTGSRPDCSKLRGIEKAECERRDTSRDDLPAGVTTTQPERPQE